MDRETKRQLFHILIGFCALSALLLLGRKYLIAADFVIILIGTILINQRLLGKSIFWVEWFESQFERPDVLFPGWGSACYAAGILICATFLTSVPQIAAVITVLALGDSLSTLIGRYGGFGKIRLFYNPKKSLLGSAAFFFASLASYFFLGDIYLTLALSLVCTIVESLPIPFDDNITIPIAATIFFLVII
ncbi:hypothetical protein HY990_03305 [Candidatus Micrarchaeota archaeon]|nr:hypothetical protein [Candidatus Micrarchaeota archaeon]